MRSLTATRLAQSAMVARARQNLTAAGLDDLVEIRVGDALQTLAELDGDLDLVMLDGAFSLYLKVLELLGPRLRTGALLLAENAFEQASGYLQHVRDPRNGYFSQRVLLDQERGNELTVVTR